jgi:hypothetical protein
LPGSFPRGTLFLQPSPLPRYPFLCCPLPFLAGTFLQRARQFPPGSPLLLRGLFALGEARSLGGVLLLPYCGAFPFLAGAFLSGCALALELCGAFPFLAGAFFGGAFLLLPGPFFGGCALALELCGAFPFLGGAFFGGAFLSCLAFALELCGAFLFFPGTLLGGAFPFLAGAFRCGVVAFFAGGPPLLPGVAAPCGTSLPDAALIPNPSVLPGRVILLRFGGKLWLYRVSRFYGAIRLGAAGIRAGNGSRCGQARQWCRIELRILA